MTIDPEAAWIEEVLKHRDFLQRLARHLLAPEDRADDLYQATLERAVSQPPLKQDNVRGWLATVMVNLKRAWGRSESRDEVRERKLAFRYTAELKEPPTPDELVARLEKARKLYDTVERLEQDYRLVIQYRIWDEASFEQIAEQLEISEAAARTRWQRGLARLRNSLASEADEWRDICRAVLGVPASIVGAGLPSSSQGESATQAVAKSTVRSKAVLKWGTIAALPLVIVSAGLILIGPGQDPVQAVSTEFAKTTVDLPLYRPSAESLESNESSFRVQLSDEEIEGLRDPSDPVQPPESSRILVRFLALSGKSFSSALQDYPDLAGTRLVLAALFSKVPLLNLPLLDRSSYSRIGDGSYHGRGLESAEDLPEGFDGYLELEKPFPGHLIAVCGNLILGSEYVEVGQTEVTFRLSVELLRNRLGKLQFQIVHGVSREPVSQGAQVWLGNIDILRKGKIESDGRVTFSSLAPGHYRLLIRMVDNTLHTYQKWITVESGPPLNLGEVALYPPRAISGLVLGPNGRTMPGVDLACVSRDNLTYSQRLNRFNPQATTDENGRFVIQDAGPDTQVLIPLIDESWAASTVLVDSSLEAVEGIKVQLRRGISVSLEPFWGAVESRSVVIRPFGSNTVPVWSRWIIGDRPCTVRLEAGRYLVEITDHLGRHFSQELNVSANDIDVIVRLQDAR